MTNSITIFKREMISYFYSPIAYIVIAVFLLSSGYFFARILALSQQATLMYSLANTQVILSILAPVITMRLLSEEVKSGTIEMLMTAPVTDFEVVFGKFLAALCLYLVMLAPTLLYVVFLGWVGDPDMGPIISSYIGLALMGAMFVSIGLLMSALTRNQIVAGVLGIVTLVILFYLGFAVSGTEGWYVPVLQYVGTYDHWEPFTKGLVDTKDVIYYVSITVLCLFITIRTLESSKWR
ncbi:MAG TPA: ABC transporter permease [Candidatus Tripitaka californicus]|uniref:ABC transporter permease n=1 Tax=Candidatus Tripitaka californicus TaxID=3367616 RepID=UPI004024D071|nr:ABC transporter permease subunit [Planctomycetota bacterium]